MNPNSGTNPPPAGQPQDAAKHVEGAHHLLRSLKAKLEQLEQHPELDEAIREVETALNILTIKTAGLL